MYLKAQLVSEGVGAIPSFESLIFMAILISSSQKADRYGQPMTNG